MKIVDLGKYKQDRTPQRSGPAKCMNCQHEWEETHPEEVYELDCPKCNTKRGVWQNHQPVIEGDLVWACSTCGGDFFMICKSPHHGVYHMCITCGRRSTPEE